MMRYRAIALAVALLLLCYGIAEKEEGRAMGAVTSTPLPGQWFSIDKPTFATVSIPAHLLDGIYIQSDGQNGSSSPALGAAGVYPLAGVSHIKVHSGSANIIDPGVTGKLQAREIDFGILFYDQRNNFLGGTVLASLIAPALPLGAIGFTAVMQKEYELNIEQLLTLPARPAYFAWFVESDVQNSDATVHRVQFTLDLTWEVF
jgi:hypothetical protein